MSHSVNIKTEFKNLSNLLAQFIALGWRITQNEKCNTYFSDPRKEEVHRYVAKNPAPRGFDIGIDLDAEGCAYFVCDFYDRSIEQQLGPALQKIKQGYSLSELKDFMQEEGLDYSVNQLATGELVVTAQN